MSTVFFLIAIIIVLLVYIFVKHQYTKDFKVQQSKRKREQRVKNFVYSAFDIDKIEAIHYKKSLIELIYKQKTITVKKEQIIFVDYEYQEKLESQYKMSSDVDRAELFDLIIESTYFYITENHYFTLVINSKNHNRIWINKRRDTLKPVVKEYINVDELEVDIKALKDQGVNVQNIYILTKNSEYITNIINKTHVTSISYYPIDSNNTFEDKSENIKEKLKTLDFSESEIESYKNSIFDNKIFLIVNDFRIIGVL